MNQFERDPYNEEETRLYYKWQFAQLKTGVPTWVVRNFDSDHGRVHDYYTYNGRPKHEGMVHHEYGYPCDVYKGLARIALANTVEEGKKILESHYQGNDLITEDPDTNTTAT